MLSEQHIFSQNRLETPEKVTFFCFFVIFDRCFMERGMI